VLAEAHHEYTTSVSTPVMAVSLETAALLWSICEAVRPDRILDLGSGFSTYVFGRWSNERGGARVVSVDSDEFWLGQTTAWLQSLGVDGPELRLLGDPFPSDNDVVFLDLGETTTRIGYLADAFASLDGAGVLVIDDMHHHPFGRQVRAGAKWSDMRLFSLRRQARDSYGRFPAVAVRG
jgi:predicted O-methyltransferase YrrM